MTAGLSLASFWLIASACVRLHRLGELARLPLKNAHVIVDACQIESELGDARVLVGELLPDHQRLPVRLQCRGSPAGITVQTSDVLVGECQEALEFGDSGLGVSQPWRGSRSEP